MSRTTSPNAERIGHWPDPDPASQSSERQSSGASAPKTPLTRARVRRGWSVAQLARALRVSRPTVALWEQGERCPAQVYWPDLAAALELPVDRIADLFIGYRPARFDSWPLPALAEARRSAGLTQRALAAQIGAAPTTVSMWESAGVPVPTAVIAQLTDLLGVPETALRSLPEQRPTPDHRPLRHARRQLGMTQREAAAHLGIAVGSLGRYEAGERVPPVSVVRRMAVTYRRPLPHLLRDSGRELFPLPPGARWSPEQIPQVILALRTAAGMTKTGLGRELSRSGQAVRSWEVGRTRPTTATYRRLELLFPISRGRFPG